MYNATRIFHFRSGDQECKVKKRDCFCYICSKYEDPKNRRKFNEKHKQQYHELFGIDSTVDESDWVPKTICALCRKMLGSKKTEVKMKVPTIWKEPFEKRDCYFCNTNLLGINSRVKSKIKYANVKSVTKPVYLSRIQEEEVSLDSFASEHMDVEQNLETDAKESLVEEIERVPDEEGFTENDESIDGDTDVVSASDDEEYTPNNAENSKGPIAQEHVNDLIRDLGLPKNGAEYLASWLKGNTNVADKIKVSYYRDRDKEFREYFANDAEYSLVYCKDIVGLMNRFKQGCYKANEWRLFIDSSKRSLKAVLLHNTNVYAAVPIGYSVILDEWRIKYKEHQWQICGDLKVLTILLGQQSGFTKYPCFLCEWDSRDRTNHYSKSIWPLRQKLEPGSKNVIEQPLVDPSKILIPPLHIKLGLMKQWVKSLNKDGSCFRYLRNQFPKLSDVKVREGIFDGPQIRRMINDKVFVTKMDEKEKEAWLCFKNVIENFLGYRKSPDYKQIVLNLVESYKNQGCLMNLKLHFLHSHVDDFPNNLGDYSEEQGERFHQDIKEMERRYQGTWNINMLADYCWSLKRDLPSNSKKRKRNPLRRSFDNKIVRYHKKE